jgi:hypothetical protein
MSALHLNVISPNQYCLNIREYVKNKEGEKNVAELFYMP